MAVGGKIDQPVERGSEVEERNNRGWDQSGRETNGRGDLQGGSRDLVPRIVTQTHHIPT